MARITFRAQDVQLKQVNGSNEVDVEVVDNIAFFTAILKDEVLAEFFNDLGTKRFMLTKHCTVDDVIQIFDKEELLKKLQETP